MDKRSGVYSLAHFAVGVRCSAPGALAKAAIDKWHRGAKHAQHRLIFVATGSGDSRLSAAAT
ncbi:hypothetical protein [Comamonas sp. MYb21]|uniref:hypothetical protein n=1 Tax=Comamonas sp. MYb21 TaxID=1848648 RepID=UPI0030DC481A